MKLHHISLRVKDFESSLSFYRQLVGLEIAKSISVENGNVAYLQNEEGETMLELIALQGDKTFEGGGIFLCFASADLEGAHKRAVELGLNPSDIRNPEPGAKYFYLYDPDRLSIQIREYK